MRSNHEPTHFTDLVISQSHLTVFGTIVVWAIAGAIHVWPCAFGGATLYSISAGSRSFRPTARTISATGWVPTLEWR